jgi:hypothetical protein
LSKTSFVKYLERREWVPSGNFTNPVISYGFLRWGPARTSIYYGFKASACNIFSTSTYLGFNSFSAFINAFTPSYIS